MRYFNYQGDIGSTEGTGGITLGQQFKTIKYPFDRFQIEIKLTKNNEFVGVSSVEINKDFMSYQDKISLKGFHDVEKFYKE